MYRWSPTKVWCDKNNSQLLRTKPTRFYILPRRKKIYFYMEDFTIIRRHLMKNIHSDISFKKALTDTVIINYQSICLHNYIYVHFFFLQLRYLQTLNTISVSKWLIQRQDTLNHKYKYFHTFFPNYYRLRRIPQSSFQARAKTCPFFQN